MSVRFKDARVLERMQAEAVARHVSASALAEQLIDEGLRSRRHPLIAFRDGPAGRRAHLVGGPDVWEVVDGVVGGDVPVDERLARATELFGLRPALVEAALAYYAEYEDEVDALIGANRRAADEAEQLWIRQQRLLAR